jgi:hypothetical protein
VPWLFAYGSEGGIVRKRRAIKAEHGLTQDDIHRVLTETYEHDPLDYARYLDARRTLLILARFDAAIPYRNGLELRDAIGGPQTIVLPVGHYSSGMFVPYIQTVTTEFFRRELADPEVSRR